MAAFSTFEHQPEYADHTSQDITGVGFGVREAACISNKSPFKYAGTTCVNQCIACFAYNPALGIAAGTHLDPEFFDLPTWKTSVQSLLSYVRSEESQPIVLTLIGGIEGQSEQAVTQLSAFVKTLPNVTIRAQIGDDHPRAVAINVEDGTINRSLREKNLQYYPDKVTLYYKPYNFNPPKCIDLLYCNDEWHRNPPIKLPPVDIRYGRGSFNKYL